MTEKNTEQRWHLVYRLDSKPEGVTREQIPEGAGATDAALVGSILYPPDGSLSVQWFGGDGRTGAPLSEVEWFKAWASLSHALSESVELDDERRAICARAFEEVRSLVLRGRS